MGRKIFVTMTAYPKLLIRRVKYPAARCRFPAAGAESMATGRVACHPSQYADCLGNQAIRRVRVIGSSAV